MLMIKSTLSHRFLLWNWFAVRDRGWMALVCLFTIAVVSERSEAQAPQPQSVTKTIALSPKMGSEFDSHFRLLPSEEDQETGNAVPVLLRITYQQPAFMSNVYPKLHEYAEMDMDDARWKDFRFDRFAEQIIRAGSMSFADWQYPLRDNRPYNILLPDIQSQRQLVGHGMTAWIHQQLDKGNTDKALEGIRAQLACGRHCAATPIVVCNFAGLALANSAFDNLELAIQSKECPNMYWSLASLPNTLHDVGPVVRWELWAAPTRLEEPLPAIGSEQWVAIATEFVEIFSEFSSEQYTEAEGLALQKKMDLLSKQDLAELAGFTKTQIERMTKEERIMRWIYRQYLQFRTLVEPLAYQSPKQVLAAKLRIESINQELLAATGAKSSPFPVVLPTGILACRNFERRVKFLQTIEAIRDYASRNRGALPAKLDALHLPAPNDPFTEEPFLYELTGAVARLSQAEVKGFAGPPLQYELSSK